MTNFKIIYMKKILTLVALSFLLVSCGKETPKEEVEQQFTLKSMTNIPVFNQENAFSYVEKQLSFGPRNPNSSAHQQALAFLESEMKKFADKVTLQNFSYPGYNDETLNLTNVIASFNPGVKNRIFLCAHWDSRPRADKDKNPELVNKPILGANDGASGVAILLEIARLLKENKTKIGVDLILFDGEDYGTESDMQNYLLGSKYFAANLPRDYRPAFGILLDLVGDKEAKFYKETNSVMYAPDVVGLIWNAAQGLNASSFSNVEGEGIYDDHIPLNQAGLKTINIVDSDLIGANTPVERRNYWHTHNDTIENISKETLKQVGDVLSKIIYSIEFSKPNS